MTQKEFIQKYKGVQPSVTGGGRYRNWTELEQDMLADLNLLISLHQAPPVQKRMFNMNQEILVKFKEEGYNRLVDLHNELAQRAGSVKLRTVDDFKALADKDGYLRYQMWKFMKDFGDVTGTAFKDHYFVEIIFNEKDLVPYFKNQPKTEE